jgi:predicted transcriptional regulator
MYDHLKDFVAIMPSTPLSSITRMSATVKDLFTYLYDLAPLELDLLLILNRINKPLTLDEISQVTDRDRTTVFRSLQKLVNAGICNKETKTMRDGGYYHVYSPIEIETFKLETQKRVDELKIGLDRILKKFEEDMNKAIESSYRKE